MLRVLLLDQLGSPSIPSAGAVAHFRPTLKPQLWTQPGRLPLLATVELRLLLAHLLLAASDTRRSTVPCR